MDDNNQNQNMTESDGGLLGRIKESPRTVSALIIILIVAAAIYAFSDEQQREPTADQDIALNAEEETIPQEEAASEEKSSEEESSQEQTEPKRSPQVATETSSTTAPQKQVEQLSPAQKTESGYEEVAQPGDGITHLARRATTRWLTENKADFALTPEHLIYVEDYIQNRIGSKGLTLGDKQVISFDLVKEAVMAAKELNEQQLKNLSQYTYVLSK